MKLSALTGATISGSWHANGTPLPGLERTTAAKKVIVIGAGLAGLSAAYELKQAGHEVVIVEAQMRPGGRVLTLREPFSDGLYVEAGASAIPANHRLTMDYARLFGLELEQSRSSNLTSINFIKGKRWEVRPKEAFDWPFALTEEERRLGVEGLMEKYLLQIPKHRSQQITVSPDWIPPGLKDHDQLSFAEFLRRQGASSAAIKLLGFGYYDLWGEGLDQISALMLLREVRHQFSHEAAFAIKGGNDRLPRAFAEKLSKNILYGSPVVRIEQDRSKVQAVILQANTHLPISGDYLICTIPFKVLRKIKVSPAFSAEKRRVIEELPYMSISRVFLQSRRRYWIEDGFSGNAAIDDPPTIISDETANQLGTRGILQSFMAGEQARHVASMQEKGRIRHTIARAEEIYPGMQEHFEGGVSKCWDEDPWAGGAAAWFKPGQMSEFLPHIGRAEGRIHFAGEHLSPWPGWMQGAIQSGVRAAHAVNEINV